MSERFEEAKAAILRFFPDIPEEDFVPIVWGGRTIGARGTAQEQSLQLEFLDPLEAASIFAKPGWEACLSESTPNRGWRGRHHIAATPDEAIRTVLDMENKNT